MTAPRQIMEDTPVTKAPPAAAHRHAKLDRCPNCGTPLSAGESFCPRCGQANHDLHLPFRDLLAETAEGLIHVDRKSFRTIGALVIRPGFLSAEFSAGRRASYVAPIRLYIFISFLFFLLLSLGAPSRPPDGSSASGSDRQRNQLTLTFYSIDSRELKGLRPAQIDSLLEARGIALTGFNRFIAAQLGRIASGGMAEFGHLLLKGASYMMFVLMPLFALLLMLFNRKKGFFYLDHLIFSVHFHSFVFLLLTLYVITSRLGSPVALLAVLALLIGIYLFLSLRRFYGRPAAITLLNTVSIGILHVVAICGCFMLTALLSVIVF